MSIKVTNLRIVLSSDPAPALTSLSIVKTGLLALGAAAVVAGGLLVKMGVDAQSQLAIVQGLAGVSASQMQWYTAQLEQMSIQLGSTLDESAKGLYYVVSAQYTGADATNILREAMMAAKASGADLADVTHALAGAMRAYNAPVSEATHFTDLMTAAVVDGMQTYQELSSTMAGATSVAAAFHVPLVQLLAAESSITDKGLPAAMAFTGLQFAITKVMIPAADMAKKFASVGVSFDATKWSAMSLVERLNYMNSALNQTDFIKFIGGTRSSKAALDLVNDGGKAYTETLAKMGTQAGITASAFAVHDKTIAGAFEDVKAAASVAGYALVTWITPTAMDLLRNVTGLVGGLGQLFTDLGPKVTTVSAPVSDLHTHLLDMNTEMGHSYTAVAKLTVIQQAAAWIKDMGDKVTYVKNNWAQFEPYVVIGAAIIGGILVVAFLAWAAAAASAAIATLIAIAPIIAIGAAIGLLVAALIWAYQNWGWFRAAVDMARTGLGYMVSQAGGAIGVMGQLAGMVGKNVGNAFQALGGIIQKVGNLFGWIGGQVGNLLGWLGRLAGAIANIHMPSLGSLGSIHIPGFALGGLTPGGATLVGENGPELALFPPGVRILPNAATQQLMAGNMPGSTTGGSSGQDIVVHTTINMDSNTLLAKVVNRIRVATGLRV